jgi:hypothetical protein
VSPSEVLAHPVEPSLDAGATELLLRYYRSRLWQRFLVGTRLSVVAGIHQHIHDLNAVIYFARAEALRAGASRLDDSLVRHALTLVEFHLANQPRLFDQGMIGWFQAQLQSAAIAVQSLRLMSLEKPAHTAAAAHALSGPDSASQSAT